MKKTNILAVLLLMVAGVQQTWAQKVVLHKTDGDVLEYNVSKLDSMVVLGRYDTDNKEWVDLGLPSGTLWATCNIGASSPEEYGDYFAWGETEPKEDYIWSTYKYCLYPASVFTKYNMDDSFGDIDNKTELDPEDDAATANWGNDWQMPSAEQFDELIDERYTITTWVNKNGSYGRLITSKAGGRSIFLPAAGYRYSTDRTYAGTDGYYWSRSLMPSYTNRAYHLTFDLSQLGKADLSRYAGCNVRPVRKK